MHCKQQKHNAPRVDLVVGSRPTIVVVVVAAAAVVVITILLRLLLLLKIDLLLALRHLRFTSLLPFT